MNSKNKIHTRLLSCIALLLSFSTNYFSQSASVGCPSITTTGSTICSGQCATLTSTVVTPNQTTTYSVQSIPYAPFSYNTGVTILNGQDDKWSAIQNMGFNFCYFGTSYNQCVIGSNGHVTFDLTNANGFDNWVISAAIPSLADMPGNTINAAFRDIDPTSSGNIYFATYGTAPCRAIVISWDNIPMYDNPGSCSNIPNSTFQMVLHETTNYIDVFIQNSSSCTGWNKGYGIVGIQNLAGTTAYVPPARNFPTTWTATNEGWRFVPTTPNTYTVNWAGPGGPVGTGLTANVCPVATTNYTATLIVQPCNGVTSTYTSVAQVSVTPGTPIVVNSATVCQGDWATLNAAGANTYTWLPGGSNAASVTFTPATTTVYTVNGTTNNGCISTANPTITVSPLAPPIPTNNSPLCEGMTLNLNAGAVANGYNWTGPNGFSSTSQNPSINNITLAGSGTYSLLISSVSGCTAAAVTIVTVNPIPIPTANNNSPICEKQTLNFTAGGGSSYFWSGPNGFNSLNQNPQLPNALVNMSGNYTVTVTQNGCSAFTVIPAVVNANPAPAISCSNNKGCVPICVSFTCSNNTTQTNICLWDFGDGSAANGTITSNCYNTPGMYTVNAVVTDVNSCTMTTTYTVDVYPIPVADFNYSPLKPTVDIDDVIFTDASYGAKVVKWDWFFMDLPKPYSNLQNPTYRYTDVGAYPVALLVTSDHGCLDTIVRTVYVGEDFGLYVPNAFTPNNDGVNDIFQPKGFGIVKYTLRIYDRWGETLLFTNNFDHGWDGKFKGKMSEEGSYTWQIIVTDVFGRRQELTGNVTLMK